MSTCGSLTVPVAFNHHPQSSSTEAEYDRLRDLARQEAGKRSSCLAKVRSCLALHGLPTPLPLPTQKSRQYALHTYIYIYLPTRFPLSNAIPT